MPWYVGAPLPQVGAANLAEYGRARTPHWLGPRAGGVRGGQAVLGRAV